MVKNKYVLKELQVWVKTEVWTELNTTMHLLEK